MAILTKSERKLVLFLSFSLVLGSLLSFFKDANLSAKPIVVSKSTYQNERKEKKININDADEFSLIGLPGIGPSLAKRIIEYRNSQGPFKNIEDLKKPKGIGEKKFQKIKDSIVVE